MSGVEEVFKDLQADIAGFFWVKLSGEDIFKLDSRRDNFAVSSRRRNDIFIVGYGVIAVDKVIIRFTAQAFK